MRLTESREASRTADRLHLLLRHKRHRLLSNCQNWRLKDGDGTSYEPLQSFHTCCVGAEPSVSHELICSGTCVLHAAHMRFFCLFCRVSVYSLRLLLWHWSISAKSAALRLRVSGPDKWKYARARRKETLPHFMRHDDGSIAQGGPSRVPLGSQLAKALKLYNCALQLPPGLSELQVGLVERRWN